MDHPYHPALCWAAWHAGKCTCTPVRRCLQYLGSRRILAEEDGYPSCSASAVLLYGCRRSPHTCVLGRCHTMQTTPHPPLLRHAGGPAVISLTRKQASQAAPSWALGVKQLVGWPLTTCAPLSYRVATHIGQHQGAWQLSLARIRGKSKHKYLLGLARVQI